MSLTQNRAQVDKILSNVSNAYFPDTFIADQLLPEIAVKQSTGKLAGYGKGHLRIVNSIMGGKGKAPRVDAITRSTTGYELEKHGLESLVTEEEYDNVEAPFDAESDEVEALSALLALGKEYGLAAALTNTSVLTQNVTLSGTGQFSDYTNSDPLGVVATGAAAILGATGKMPNAMVMSRQTYNVLKYHPKILSTLGYAANRPGKLTEDDLAAAFDVEKIYIGEAYYNSAKDGQTATMVPLWGKDIVLFHRPKSAAKLQVSLGYNLKKIGETPRKVYKRAIFNPDNATEILVVDKYDQVLTDVGAGYLIKAAIA